MLTREKLLEVRGHERVELATFCVRCASPIVVGYQPTRQTFVHADAGGPLLCMNCYDAAWKDATAVHSVRVAVNDALCRALYWLGEAVHDFACWLDAVLEKRIRATIARRYAR